MPFTVIPGPAVAHASELGLVLLLPTDIYTGAGVAAVAATVILLALVPARATAWLFRSGPGPRLQWRGARTGVSCASALILLALVWAGVAGPRDPLANPLPLAVWTFFWIGLVTAQGLLGNLWAWLSPWSGPLTLARRAGIHPILRLRTGTWPGWISFLAFAGFLLADPAPADPDRLAVAVGLYWLAHLAAGLIFGPRWLRRGEGLTLALTALARAGIAGRRGGRLRLGLPGWQIAAGRGTAGMAVISVLLLGTGSFDGVNETFWWMNRIGVNPFEFPGRSALIAQSLGGLLLANLALAATVAGCIWLGLRLARSPIPARRAFMSLAPSLLPIALGYHIAHYLPTFLVEAQYLLVAVSDPFLTGADYLGLGEFYVSTGFFNTTASVRRIYLAQAGAVVAGHVISVLIADRVAHRLLPTRSAALRSQAPLALFMIAYTLFGLWLLASPRA